MKKILSLLMAVLVTAGVMATKYQKVTKTTDLGDGDVVVLVNETAKMVSGGISSTSKYIEKVDADVADGYASAVTTEITLGQSGDAWTLTLSGKLVGATGSGNDLTFGKTTNSTWSISIEGGDAVIKNVSASDYVIRYNASSSRFSAYKGTVQPIQLYKKVAGSAPVIGLSANTLSFTKKKMADGKASDSQELTITTADLATENLTIAVAKGEVFSVTPGELESIGGNVTVSYEASAEGEYKDTVVVTGKDNEGNAIVKKCAVSVIVEAADPVGSDATYNVLQDLSNLSTGDKVFIGTAAADVVLGLYETGNNIKEVAATYSTDKHKVTANDVYAYTVEVSDGQYTFKDVKGNYLSCTSTSSSSKLTTVATVDNKAQWTLNITDDVATIKSVGGASGREYLQYNKGSKLFACYSNGGQAAVYIYSSNAPEYQEKVLEPELNVLADGEAVGETLDWGEVVYDDSWGTEYAPYSQTMEILVTGKDLSENVTLALEKGSAFQIYTTPITPKNGSVNSKVSINFEVSKEGEYSDVLTITCGTLMKTLNLKAKAVKEASVDPSSKTELTVSTYRVYLNSYFENEQGVEEMDIFKFSAKNLKKNLYVKWLNSEGYTIPSWTGEEMTVSIAGFGDVPFGGSLTLGTDDLEDVEVTVYVKAFNSGYYESQLYFYTYEDKETLAAEYRVDLVVNMTTKQTPDPDPEKNPNPEVPSAVEDVVIVPMTGVMYNVLGQRVDESYHGVVIMDGTKVLR